MTHVSHDTACRLYVDTLLALPCLQSKVTLTHTFSRSQLAAGSTSTSSFSFSDSTLRQPQKEINMVVLDDDGLTLVRAEVFD